MIRIEKTPVPFTVPFNVFAAMLVTAGLGCAVAGDAGARERGINERQHVQQHRAHEPRNNHGRQGWSGGVHAHGNSPNGWGPHHGFGYPQGQYVDRLQHQQHKQIRQGVHNGRLTPREAHALRSEQREIAVLERHYRADGVLSAAERRDLGQRLHEAGRHIYNESHDAERNRHGYHWWGY